VPIFLLGVNGSDLIGCGGAQRPESTVQDQDEMKIDDYVQRLLIE
jgi:hypothetical protein